MNPWNGYNSEFNAKNSIGSQLYLSSSLSIPETEKCAEPLDDADSITSSRTWEELPSTSYEKRDFFDPSHLVADMVGSVNFTNRSALNQENFDYLSVLTESSEQRLHSRLTPGGSTTKVSTTQKIGSPTQRRVIFPSLYKTFDEQETGELSPNTASPVNSRVTPPLCDTRVIFPSLYNKERNKLTDVSKESCDRTDALKSSLPKITPSPRTIQMRSDLSDVSPPSRRHRIRPRSFYQNESPKEAFDHASFKLSGKSNGRVALSSTMNSSKQVAKIPGREDSMTSAWPESPRKQLVSLLIQSQRLSHSLESSDEMITPSLPSEMSPLHVNRSIFDHSLRIVSPFETTSKRSVSTDTIEILYDELSLMRHESIRSNARPKSILRLDGRFNGKGGIDSFSASSTSVEGHEEVTKQSPSRENPSMKRTSFNPRVWIREFERAEGERESIWYTADDMDRFKMDAVNRILLYRQRSNAVTGQVLAKEMKPLSRQPVASPAMRVIFSHQALRMESENELEAGSKEDTTRNERDGDSTSDETYVVTYNEISNTC